MGDAAKAVMGQLDPRLRGRRTHICISCDFPIAVYGRCAPCLHAYCLTCAAEMSACMICRTPITKLERIPGEAGLFISPATLQGYRNEADLAKHAQQLIGQIQQLGSLSGPPPRGSPPRLQRPPAPVQPPQRPHLPPPPHHPHHHMQQQPQQQQPRPPPPAGGMGPGRPMMPRPMHAAGGGGGPGGGPGGFRPPMAPGGGPQGMGPIGGGPGFRPGLMQPHPMQF